jgi:hypothetical protein
MKKDFGGLGFLTLKTLIYVYWGLGVKRYIRDENKL